MAFWDNWLKKSIQSEISELLKVDGVSAPEPSTSADNIADKLPEVPEKLDTVKQIARQFVDDPYFDMVSNNYNYKTKLSRLTNRTLKEVSLRDWLISSIIQCRVDTGARFSRPEHRRHEMGFRFLKRDHTQDYSDEERDEIAMLEDFIYHCGRHEGVPPEDKILFGEFLKLTIRDAITFGHVAIEKVKTRGGGLHRFRPRPAESIYLINKQLPKAVVQRDAQTTKKLYAPTSDNDPRAEQEVTTPEHEYEKYVQVSYDQRPLATFGDEDMIFKLFNPQNFIDSRGYCYSPLELAIITVRSHLDVENFNANFFTHGYASKGVLHLKGTVTQQQLANFRRSFQNSISGTQNAWRTPIVAGLDDIQWVPISASAREMEYINFNNHLMRIICTQFQIDPMELGLDFLVSGTGKSAMQVASSEFKVNYSRERGLLPILTYIEDLINCDILPALDKKLAMKYKFSFTGYTDETPQTEIAQLQAEVSVYKSMNDVLRQAQKDPIKEKIADLPLSAAFWALVEKNYTRGEIREKFLGDKGAADRKELQYIPGDPGFAAWQQFLATIVSQKDQKKQAAAQQDAESQQAQQEQAKNEQEHRHAEAEHGRDKEKHGMEMEQLKANAAHNVVQASLGDTAKEFGATKANHIEGQTVANPMNHIPE
jgi:HK97 family phage portal protein